MIEIKMNIGDEVILKSDSEKSKRFVTGISIRQNNCVSYELSLSNTTSWHYDFEIDFHKNKTLIGFK